MINIIYLNKKLEVPCFVHTHMGPTCSVILLGFSSCSLGVFSMHVSWQGVNVRMFLTTGIPWILDSAPCSWSICKLYTNPISFLSTRLLVIMAPMFVLIRIFMTNQSCMIYQESFIFLHFTVLWSWNYEHYIILCENLCFVMMYLFRKWKKILSDNLL